MWPFKRPVEKRDSSYTSALLSLLVSRATGDFQNVGATWAAEVAGILYSRAFSSAKVTPTNDLTAAITPSVMGQIGRDLVRRGESLHWIDMDSGRMELRPAGSWDIRGGPRESDWRYRIDLHGPSLQESQFVPSSEVIHAKYQTDSGRPWRGVSPLAGASLSSDLLSALELRLSQEAAGPSGYVLPLPMAPQSKDSSDPLAPLIADIRSSKGSTVFTETVSGGWGEGKSAAPQRDWMPSRFGANPPDVLKSLRSDAGMAVLAACGIPTAMVMGNSDGTAMREAYRRFVMLIVDPILDTLRAEIERKLETEVNFDLRALFAHDLQGRASAFQKLIAGGLSIQDSIQASGLLIIED